jgi:hypothetical protein
MACLLKNNHDGHVTNCIANLFFARNWVFDRFCTQLGVRSAVDVGTVSTPTHDEAVDK